jgi:guanylate kinase
MKKRINVLICKDKKRGCYMKVLFLVDGAAGAGKSDLVNYIAGTYRYSATKVTKFTTREKREQEEAKKSDLEFITDEEFNNLQDNKKDPFFMYSYGGKRYGFRKSDIDKAVSRYISTFIIVRSQDLINKLCEVYKKQVLVVPVYIYSDMGLIERRLQQDGHDSESIKFRIERSNLVFQDYLENDIYRNVIINRSNQTDLHRKIKALVDKYTKIDENPDRLYVSPTKYYQLNGLSPYKHTMQNLLKKHPYEKNVFLMMKFRNNNQAFSGFIKNELRKYGYNCVRADAPEWNITNKVDNPIAVLHCCKYGIALFDEPEEGANYSPNVAYELGVMHNQGKKCLILKYSGLKDVPFDLVKDLYKQYTKEIEFEQVFCDWLESINYE